MSEIRTLNLFFMSKSVIYNQHSYWIKVIVIDSNSTIITHFKNRKKLCYKNIKKFCTLGFKCEYSIQRKIQYCNCEICYWGFFFQIRIENLILFPRC